MAKIYSKKLVLDNGKEFFGAAFGSYENEIAGKLAFNTSMVGYEETITNPVYLNKILLFTYPIIGNSGMVAEDFESKSVTVKGIIVRSHNDSPSNFRFTNTVQEILEETEVTAISGVDTREISCDLFNKKVSYCAIVNETTTKEQALELIEKAKAEDKIKSENLIDEISCAKKWYARTSSHTTDVVVIDYGVTQSLVKTLNNLGANVTVVPAKTDCETIKALRPDAIYLTGGPADADGKQYVETIKNILGLCPIKAEGVGAMFLAKALGLKTVPLEVGHHGSNQPVKNVKTNKLESLIQTHDYTIEKTAKGVTITYENVLDGSVEGFEVADKNAEGVFFLPNYNTKQGKEFFDSFIKQAKGE